ncbi:MAG: nitroreductase family protein [bacterium]
MDVKDAILNRRSIRKYTDELVNDEKLMEILEAARWAPSGLNNQPWRFVIVRERKEELASLTKYSHVIKEANLCIAVFLDHASSYDRTKDILAIGAAIQNMLLYAYSIGIGTCWLGEILNRKEEVNALLEVQQEMELMAVITLGYPNEKPTSSRKEIDELVIVSNKT